MDMANAFSHLSPLGLFLAAASAFVVGGAWYGPLFGRAWAEAWGFSEDDLKNRNAAKIFGLSFVLMAVAAFNLAMFLGPQATAVSGAVAGALAGIGWVATFLGVLALFEGRSFAAFAIDAGYCAIALTLMGAVLGAFAG